MNDLKRSRDFYVDLLGFVETDSDRSHVYLRGFEDRFHHCLVLTEGEAPAVGHISYRVRSDEDLAKIETMLCNLKLTVKKIHSEKGQGPAIRVQDPMGFPIEFFREMDEAEWMIRRFHEHKRARVMRLDHFNVLVPNVNEASDWYTKKLGFECSEYTEDDAGGIWATWLRRKPTVHDIAIMTGKGPRVHHAGFAVAEKDNILDCADFMASKGFINNMERGPGRHGISNAFFLYLRDPDGHRIELYTGDYLSTDPDWKPLKWKLDDPQRQTFWGAPAPERWFNEASNVLSVTDGSEIPTKNPVKDLRKKGDNALH